eukprot:2858571-Pyramimonas_sp.AAC.3
MLHVVLRDSAAVEAGELSSRRFGIACGSPAHWPGCARWPFGGLRGYVASDTKARAPALPPDPPPEGTGKWLPPPAPRMPVTIVKHHQSLVSEHTALPVQKYEQLPNLRMLQFQSFNFDPSISRITMTRCGEPGRDSKGKGGDFDFGLTAN